MMKPTSDVLDTKTTSPDPGVSMMEGKKQCPDCGKFFQKGYLKLHRDAVHLKKQIMCQDCGKPFSFVRNLDHHKKKVCKGNAIQGTKSIKVAKANIIEMENRKEDDERVQCKKCGKEIKKKSLARHNKQVHMSRQVQCNQCGKEMRNERSLAEHIQRIHNNVRTFVKCDLCEKSLEKKNMKRHQAMHRRVFIEALRV